MKTSNETKEKVVVIGGGVAGLSAGVYALKAGFEVEIYEKNKIPGGECIGWNRKGYHIDNCIHWLTGTRKGTELYDVWKTVGALTDETEYAPLDAFYTSTYNGERATLWNDLKKTEEELIKLSPEDEDEIKKFIRYVEYSKQCLFPAAKPMEMWGIRDYIRMGINMKDFPKVMKEFGKISLEDYSKRFKSPLLQKLMCDYLPKSYCAYSFLVSYATMADGNGNIPMGASLQMSLRMEKKFKELGGVIHYGCGVNKINIEKKMATGIELEDGSFVKADYVIPTVDTGLLFGKFLSKDYMPKELKTAYENEKAYPATSGFQVAFAVDKNFNRSGEMSETVFIDIEPIKVGNRSFDRMYVKAYGYDPVCVKDDKQVIQTCITQTDEDYYFWKSLSKEEYEKVKTALANEVAKHIEKAFPEIKDSMEYLDAWTPLTYERYCNAYHGSYMSFVTTPYGKQIKMKGQLKGIKNLYVAGQWTNSPGGLPVAVASGKFAVQRILKKQHRDINI
ncbi:MAG: NAD(P)/FAD-dependent oxidoreductase [Lachnospiraceae bacterium]|nr:NAD(P)/FAD-dependent oxidoreductase [Lachnospiraceae bacterium]